jgi:hypothetical protein
MEEYGWLSTALYGTYLLIGVATIAAVVMPLIKSFDNPKSLVKSGIGLLAIVILFFICYSISDSTVPAVYTTDKYGVTEGLYKFVGGSIVLVYVLIVGVVVSIIASWVSNLTK